MKQTFTRLALLFVIVVAVYPATINAQGPIPPLTRDELIDLCQRPVFQRNPGRVLTDFIRKNKITFLPTRATVRYLNENGVPKIITDELKHNFASHIVYRVCQFEPVEGEGAEFTKTLNTILDTDRMFIKASADHLLQDKGYEPVPAGPTGPTRQELEEHPHSGYVLIMGDIENKPGSQKKIVTSRLAFVSRMQDRMSIAKPIIIEMNNTPSSREAVARQIARWSIEEVENQIK